MKRNIHFIGIGGIGMSALARYYKAQNWSVSGSDSANSQITDSLKKERINVKIGHKKVNIPANTTLVVYNRAIPESNPEILTARKMDIATVPYAKVLGEITKQYETIAITGSHGKSTTTALAGIALIKAGLDPTILIGTNLKELNGKNIRVGKGPYLVLEADDFGAAFLAYSPVISIITNIDREHMDFYKNFANVRNAFLKFIAQTRPGGTVILNHDDKNIFSLKKKIDVIARKGKLKIVWYSTSSAYSLECIDIRSTLKIPGEHNVSNSMAVLALGKLLRIPQKKIFGAIGGYTGAWRRFEHRGELKIRNPESGIQIYDDYAHHPTEIKATLQGFRAKFSQSTLICIFQPHQAKRLELLFKEFVNSFNDANILILLPSYQVAGRDLINKNYTSEKLAEAIKKKYPKKEVYYLADPKRLKLELKKILLHSPFSTLHSVLVMMGAGDIVNYTASLMNRSSS